LKCQRCQKDAKVLTPLPDSDEHVCEECYAAAYRKAHAGGGRKIGVAVGSILAALAVGVVIYLLVPKGKEPTPTPTEPKEAKTEPSVRPGVTPPKAKTTRPTPRPKTPARTESGKAGPAVAKAGPDKKEGVPQDPAEKKEEPAEKKAEPTGPPGAENAFVRVAAKRASTVGSLTVRYLLPAETEEEPPRTEQATLNPANGTFLRLDLDVEILSGESIALGTVSLTAAGGTYSPSQWEAFGRGCQGVSGQDLVIMRGAALEIFISGEQDDVVVEGGGGYVSRSSYVRDGGERRVPVALYFDVPARPEGVGVMNVAGVSFDIDFSTLGQ